MKLVNQGEAMLSVPYRICREQPLKEELAKEEYH